MGDVYLDGDYMPLEEARVPVMDRGFLFGDGVYEVIPVYGGRLFRLDQHLQRLASSLDAIRLGNPLDTTGWRTLLEQLVEREQAGNIHQAAGAARVGPKGVQVNDGPHTRTQKGARGGGENKG